MDEVRLRFRTIVIAVAVFFFTRAVFTLSMQMPGELVWMINPARPVKSKYYALNSNPVSKAQHH